MQQVLIIFTFIYLFYIVNLVSFPAAPSVQDPRPGGSTIRGFVPHIPEEPSGMKSAICGNVTIFLCMVEHAISLYVALQHKITLVCNRTS